MSDYQQLAAQFDGVRTSWKRTAALSGLAIVITESIGILTVLLFLDWLYQPLPMLRLSMWTAAVAVVIWFVMRHVLSPLSKKIPDEQIALYIEEHRADLDGVLITAAEYGQRRERATGGQAALIDAVMNEASAKARATISHVVDLSRLKKYCIAAAAGIGVYILLCVLFPNAIGHHIGRILQPWRTTAEDLPKRPAGPVLEEPVKFTLSKGDASLSRGSSFEFEATLSHSTSKAVALNFRPRAQGEAGAWQTLPMTEIEKLNGYAGALPDVNEDLEYYVSCGGDKSETHRLTVFDPLVVQSLDVTTHYPAYVKLADKVEKQSTGDVEALIGSTVTVRINASTPLKEGQVKWGNGQTQPVTVDPQSNTGATFSFEVKEDGAYDYALTDANGQQAASTASLSVKAITDQPPTLNVKSPQSPVLTTPIGEVNFEIEATDDFGVEGVDLVYSRFDAEGKPNDTRIPLTLVPGDSKAGPNAVRSTYHLALEDMKPPLKSEEALPYHLEARDAKGQIVVSDIGMVVIGYYETWGTWQPPHGPEEEHPPEGPGLIELLSMVWFLDAQKPKLAPDDYKSQSKEIAGKMEEGGGVRDFVNLEHFPQLARVKNLINGHAAKAHAALAGADTHTASLELSIAVALYSGNGVMQDASLHESAGSPGTMAGGAKPPALTMLEQARLDALNADSKNKPQDNGKEESKAIADTNKNLEDLMKKQDTVVAQAQTPNGQSGQSQNNGQQPQNTGQSKTPDKQGDLAKTQKEIADKTKEAADKAKGAPGGGKGGGGGKLHEAADKTNAAAKEMEEAAKNFAAGNTAAGIEKATDAKKKLQDAHDTLQDTSRDKLEAAISEAAELAAALLDKQSKLRTDTEASAKALDGGKTPDQRQKRDLEKQAYQQTYLRADQESLNNNINTLSAWAVQVGQDEAIHSLAEAQKTIKRSQPEVKMGNAVIDLNNATPAPATEEQKKAEDAVQKIIDDLHNSSDALAASKEAQLRRAQRTAAEVKKGLDQLTGKEQKTGEQGKAGEQPKAGEQGKAGEQAKAGEQGKAGEQAKAGEQGKAGEQAKAGEQGKAGEQAKAGEQGKAGEQAKAGEQGKAGEQAKAGEQGKTGEQAKAGEQGKAGEQAKAGEQGKGDEPPGPAEKDGRGSLAPGNNGGGGGQQQKLQKLSYDLQRLVTNLENRDLVSQKDVDQLKDLTMDKAALEKRLAIDPALLRDVSDLVERVSDKLEAASEAKTEASKLFTSQREECPPAYRQFVNQYFEALSQAGHAPQQPTRP